MANKKKDKPRKFKSASKKEKGALNPKPKRGKAFKLLKNLKFISASLIIFIIALGVLFEFPAGINLAQKTVLAQPYLASSGAQTNGEVAGVAKTPSVVIDSKGVTPPTFSAAAVIAEDFDSGEILYQKDIHKRLLPASTTKLMTALVSIDYYKMSDVLTATSDDLVGGSVMGLVDGEKATFRSLLYGMLLNSGNDAAFTLRSNYRGGIDNFVKAMNNKAQSLGLLNTHFQNPAGFDDKEQYSSAYDLAKIALSAALNPELAKITSTKTAVVYSVDGGKEHNLQNVNQLLGVDGVIGMKTGYTEQAGENLVGLVDRDGHKVLTVVLASNNRFAETKTLMDWVYQNYSWKIVR